MQTYPIFLSKFDFFFIYLLPKGSITLPYITIVVYIVLHNNFFNIIVDFLKDRFLKHFPFVPKRIHIIRFKRNISFGLIFI